MKNVHRLSSFPIIFLIIGLLFSFNVSANTVPLALAPTDTISKTNPRFYWTIIPGFDRYSIRIWSGGSIVFDEITTDALSCNDNFCSYRKSSNSFSDGSYTWRVRSIATNGQAGSWSKSQSFVVNTESSADSSAISQLVPSTLIDTAIPIFSWVPVTNINKYVIKVLDSQGGVAFSGLTPNNFSCSVSSCSYSRPTWSLSDGDASWQIRTEADDGTNGVWSDLVEFSVDTSQLQIPEQLYPTINTASNTPQFAWKALDGFNKYAIRLRDNNRSVVLSKVTPGNFSCPDGVCIYNPQGVSFIGSGSWQIRTEATDGTDGPWSDYLSFRVVTSNSRWGPGAISPKGIIETVTNTFKWENSNNDVYQYAIRVLDSSGAMLFNTITPPNLDCPGGICSFVKQGVTLPENEILSWTVRTEGADGANGSRSTPQYFQIGGTNNPPVAVITPDITNIYRIRRTMHFSGEQSSDPEQATLTHTWKVQDKPSNSNVSISSTSGSFWTDKIGVYTLSLTVSDGLKDSTTLLNLNITSTGDTQSESPPTIDTFTTDVNNVQLGQSMQFEFYVFDANDDNVTCYLDFVGDKKAIRRFDDCGNRRIRVNHTYSDMGLYAPLLMVTDGNHNPISYRLERNVFGPITFNTNSFYSTDFTTTSSQGRVSFLCRLSSLYQLQSVKARILDSRVINDEANLSFAFDFELFDITGGGTLTFDKRLSTGYYISEYIAEDVLGNKAYWYEPFYYQQAVELTANLPTPLSVVTSPVVDATCSYDESDCTIRVNLGNNQLLSGIINQLPPTQIDLSSFDSGRYQLTVYGVVDVLSYTSTQSLSSLVYVENSDKLMLMDKVPGQIFDASESKILYQLPNDTGGYDVFVHDRASETTISVAIPRGLYSGSLTAKGAILRTLNPLIYEMHEDDGLLTFPGTYNIVVAGDYAMWSEADTQIFLKNILTGSITNVDEMIFNHSSDIASNGILAYSKKSPRGLMRYDAKTGLTDTLKPSDGSAYVDKVKTDGSNFVYQTKELGGSDVNQLIYFDGTTEEVLDSRSNPLSGQFYINNGWVAFTKSGTLWVRSPTGVISRRTYYATSIEIETLGDNGDVMFIYRNDRYLSTDLDDPLPTLIHVNQQDSRSLQINGIWHVYIGNSLFQVIRPPVAITTQLPMYLTADKGDLWDTTESVSRINTVFTQAEIETTFITLNDILHAYKDWTDVDAPYASAHTRDSYSEYALDLEFKWGAKKFNPRLNKPKDAGIMFHIYGPSNEPWPSGLEFQLKEPDQYGDFVSVRTRAKVTHTNGIYDETATPVQVGREVGAESIEVNILGTINPDWNAVRLEVSGDSGVYYFNGEKVMEFTDAEYYDHNKQLWFPLTHGRIILQAGGAEIEYRNITLSPLTP